MCESNGIMFAFRIMFKQYGRIWTVDELLNAEGLGEI